MPRRGLLSGVDDIRIVGVQLPQSIDQWFGSRRTVPGRFTHRMVPDKRCNAGLQEKGADDGDAGLQREFRSIPEIKDSFFRVRRRGFRMDERPAPIENRSSQVFRDVDVVQIRRAEGRHEEDKLQVRHSGILDIERLHDAAIIDRDLD